jgi:hypothetical protein
MNNYFMKLVLVSVAIVVIAAVVIVTWNWYVAEQGAETVAPAAPGEPWTWENPLTGKTATIPADWKEAKEEAVQGTVLTLTHKTDKCLLYLVHEENADDVSLQEYIAARGDTMRRELAIEKLEPAPGGDSYEGEGAKLFQRIVADTKVIIWRSSPRHFWRAATITDPDYKYLEFDARNIIESLRKTTQ